MPLVGMVENEPEVKDTTAQFRIGRILIIAPKYPEYKYGDILEVSGKLEKYPYKGDILYSIYKPEIKIIERGKGSFFYSKILNFKTKLRERVNLLMPSPESAIMGASIIGGEFGISKNLQAKLNIAGVRHIIAVSGMNLVIVSNILMFVFLKFKMRKKWAIILSLAFIFLFLALCAFTASAVRAGIMTSLFLIAPIFGRKSCGIRTIVVSALAMLLFDPFLIWNVGFQLSFLATLGMIYFSNILPTTLAAYVFTLPILIYSFGQISLFGILTNLFILPVVAPIMVIGMISIFLGPLAAIIPYFLIKYLLFIVDLFSKPWMAITFQKMHIFWLIVYYVIVFSLANYIYRRSHSLPYFLR